MNFRTRVDLTNRQAKQYEKTNINLSGGTVFGLPYSALTSGIDTNSSGISETYTSILSTFSGNTGTTNYSWYDSRMSLGESELSALTSSNSGVSQDTNFVFVVSSSTTIDNNVVNLSYSGVSFDITVNAMLDLGGGNYSGSVITNELNILSANTLDFTGRTIWVDVSGITRTERLIVTDTPTIGYVLKCVDSEGMVAWAPDSSGTTGSTSYWSAGTGSNAIVKINSGCLASAIGSVVGATNSTSNGQYSAIIGGFGHSITAGSDVSSIFGGADNTINSAVDYSICIGGRTNIVSNSYSGIFVGQNNTLSGGTDLWSAIIGGNNNTLIASRSLILGGSNIVGSEDDTVYVPYLNINNLGTGTSVTNLSVDVNGYVVSGSSIWTAGTGTNSAVLGGSDGVASGITSVSEGLQTVAGGNYSHAEGWLTFASGTTSHAEGYLTIANNYAHAEGSETVASGVASHAEGSQTVSSGPQSHAEGSGTIASGDYSHAEGQSTTASGVNSHAEGVGTIASGQTSHAEGSETIAGGNYSHAEGYFTVASGDASHAEGDSTISSGLTSHAEGNVTQANGVSSHSEGSFTIANGANSHAEGSGTIADGTNSHAEGQDTTASGENSHSEGYNTIASGTTSHAGGSGSTASGINSFIHSNGSIVTGNYSAVIGGSSITGSSNNTVYVPDLVIDGLTSTDPLATDSNGLIVAGASDVRLKTNIQVLESALDKIKNLRGVSYEWTEESGMGAGVKKYGLIAQEVQQIIPDMVRERSKGDGMLSLSYTEIVPWLIEAIKELTSGITLSNKHITLETQTIASEDNNIELNYGGNKDTAIGGGITVLHAITDGVHSEIKTDENGNWIISPPLITKQYTPKSTNDEFGKIGDTVWDDDYTYIKTNNGWKRTSLENF